MISGNQRRGQLESKFNPHNLLMKNGKRNSDSQMQSAFEGDCLKTCAGPQKRRAVRIIRPQRAVAESSLPMVEKVDTFPFPRKQVGEDCAYLSSFEDRVNQSVKKTESSLCSVASSGSYMTNYKSSSGKKHLFRRLVNSPLGDAQSSCECPNGRKTEPSGKNVAAKVHKLELSAYRKILRAFYASGCITWEQEALLTDLRLSLHISHDEHVSELTCLCPAKAV